jgi:hypothetical protein
VIPEKTTEDTENTETEGKGQRNGAREGNRRNKPQRTQGKREDGGEGPVRERRR